MATLRDTRIKKKCSAVIALLKSAMATKIPMSVPVIDPYPPKEAKEAKNVSPKSKRPVVY